MKIANFFNKYSARLFKVLFIYSSVILHLYFGVVSDFLLK